VSDCLRKEILTYFGEIKPLTRPDECCSLCTPNLVVPWANEASWEDLSDPARYSDAKFTVLKAIAWNARFTTSRNRGPYGNRILSSLLIGDDYNILRYEKDPQRKQEKRHNIMDSGFFGVLEGLQGSTDTIGEIMADLTQKGFTIEERREWKGISYSYMKPTELGQARLEEGRFFE
jgi:hypothetical protein